MLFYYLKSRCLLYKTHTTGPLFVLFYHLYLAAGGTRERHREKNAVDDTKDIVSVGLGTRVKVTVGKSDGAVTRNDRDGCMRVDI